MEGKKERRRKGGKASQSFLSLQRKREAQKGEAEVDVTPTLGRSCLWGGHVSELSSFGCQVPLPPKRSPILPASEALGLRKAGAAELSRVQSPNLRMAALVSLLCCHHAEILTHFQQGALIFILHRALHIMWPVRADLSRGHFASWREQEGGGPARLLLPVC